MSDQPNVENDQKIFQDFFMTILKTNQAWTYSQSPGQFHVYAYTRPDGSRSATCPLWSTAQKAKEHAQFHGDCELVALSVGFLTEKMLLDLEKENIMIGLDWEVDNDNRFDADAGGVRSILLTQNPELRVSAVDEESTENSDTKE